MFFTWLPEYHTCFYHFFSVSLVDFSSPWSTRFNPQTPSQRSDLKDLIQSHEIFIYHLYADDPKFLSLTLASLSQLQIHMSSCLFDNSLGYLIEISLLVCPKSDLHTHTHTQTHKHTLPHPRSPVFPILIESPSTGYSDQFLGDIYSSYSESHHQILLSPPSKYIQNGTAYHSHYHHYDPVLSG